MAKHLLLTWLRWYTNIGNKQGDELYLTVKSIGNGVEIEGIDTLKIEKLTTDSLVLNSNYGYTLRYAKEKSTKP